MSEDIKKLTFFDQIRRRDAIFAFIRRCCQLCKNNIPPSATYLSPHQQYTPYTNCLLFYMPDGHYHPYKDLEVINIDTSDKIIDEAINSDEFKELLNAFNTTDYRDETHRHKDSHYDITIHKIVAEKSWCYKSYRIRVFYPPTKWR